MGAADARLRPALSCDLPCTPVADGVMLAVRLTPRATRSIIAGTIADGDGRPLLQIRLAAPPVEGAANRALIAFLADALGCRKADVTIRAGETARIKRLHIADDPALLGLRIGRLIDPA